MPTANSALASVKLADFDTLQARYLPLALPERARAMLEDAIPALTLAVEILNKLHTHKLAEQSIANLRKSLPLMGRIRPSEAKNHLQDSGSDFIRTTLHKLAAWQKNLERISAGEGIIEQNGRAIMEADSPVALAYLSNQGIGNYLSIIQLVLGELSRLDGKNASQYAKTTAQLRRCATVLSDCEIASGVTDCIA